MSALGGTPRWAKAAGSLGRVLVVLGVLILLFVVYQLWGTGLQEAAAQRDLRSRFGATLATAPGSSPRTPTTTTAGPPPTTTPNSTTGSSTAPVTQDSTPASTTTTVLVTTTVLATHPGPVREGDPVARLQIPKIGVDDIVVAGTNLDDLKKGPGLYTGSPLPGQRGNAAIAGHRTTFGAPFYRVNELAAGDEIKVTTVQGVFVYRVRAVRVVSPSDVSVIAPTPDAELTLTSCHPRFSASLRIIVFANLDPSANGAPLAPDPPVTVARPATTTNSSAAASSVPDATQDPATVGTSAPASTPGAVPDAFTGGWFNDGSAWPQVIVWGLGLGGVWVAARELGRRWRRWPAVLGAVAPSVVLLYFFYENVARLLPPNL